MEKFAKWLDIIDKTVDFSKVSTVEVEIEEIGINRTESELFQTMSDLESMHESMNCETVSGDKAKKTWMEKILPNPDKVESLAKKGFKFFGKKEVKEE